ncbi:folate family ECF transporter S component [Vagococcus elongatus]|uniref:ECF transporter S component n=1 Tax=Vagococcus elongatus TaxID=180344 RepID=A0A430B129_9ENTE|nr:folate family ECF transporter S component [Vagococcus elongatus]RSU14025.1 hypothetical protein CBF29_03840 [Vagococcus elongatus]
MKKKMGAREIVLMGVLIALEIVISRFISVQTEFFKISFGFIPVVIMGIIFGPFLAGIGAGLANLFGFFIHPVGQFFPGFTLTAALMGIIYGVFFYGKKISWQRMVIASVIASVVETGLNTLWLYLTLGSKTVLFYLPTRLITAIVMIGVKILVIRLITEKDLLRKTLTDSYQFFNE